MDLEFDASNPGLFWKGYYKRKFSGWIEIVLGTECLTEDWNVQVNKWCLSREIQDFCGTGQYWLFKDKKDATIFALGII